MTMGDYDIINIYKEVNDTILVSIYEKKRIVGLGILKVD